ncbi:hypothetical protein C7I87_33290 [Mesorhizobium sp. SARCC-RB16n]|nr:hypothetical protein C7I87_33290 [Mesorhizobium sp. SARCC-RB16n]
MRGSAAAQSVGCAAFPGGRQFRVTRTHAISLPEFVLPVDIVPAIPEIANPRFSSHTTLAGVKPRRTLR